MPSGKTLPDGTPPRATITPGQLSVAAALPSAALFTPGMHFAMEMRDGRVHATTDDVIVRAPAKAARRGAA